MIKNASIYRIQADEPLDAAIVQRLLAEHTFAPCSPTQPLSVGWVPPRGEHNELLEVFGGHWLMKLMVERKDVPKQALDRRVEELANKVEQETGRKPGKKMRKELKEQVFFELLPQAFTKRGAITVWLSMNDRLLVIDSASASRCDDVITALVRSVPGLAVLPLHTAVSAGAAMTDWLLQGAPSQFTIDRDCELKSSDELKSTVRYGRHPLDIDEVREHIEAGKLPTRLAATWDSRVSFLLTDAMQLRRLEFLDVVFESGKPGKEEAFDADAVIATTELSRLIADLVAALGGEPIPV